MVDLLAAARRLLTPLSLRKAVPTARTRIVKAEVKRLSLCRRGKNGLTTLYKADGQMELQTLVKAVDEGTLLAVMYAPERPDADGHIASAEVCRQMLHSLMRHGAELDIEHDGKVLAKSQAYVAEAFLVQKGDPRFAGWKNYDGTDAGDLTGAAAVQVNIDDPALRASRLAGAWDGISLFGAGVGVPEGLPLAKTDDKEPHMTPEQLKALLDGFNAGLANLQTALVKALKPEATETPAPAAKPEAVPAFEGDPTNPADLEKFEKALRAHELRKAVASGTLTADQIAELRKGLAEDLPSDEEIGAQEGDSPLVKSLRLQLHKAMRASNAPAKGPARPAVSQTELDVAEGLALAKALNGEADKDAPKFTWITHPA